VVCGWFVGVCVSFCGLSGCDWVVETVVLDIEGGVWRVRRGGVRKVGGPGVCVRGKMSLSLFSR
jgi:hypothetical protein